MASNSFGTIFRFTTWGESHGPAIGVVLDGCPAGIELTEEEINAEMRLRSPGKNVYTSPRKESDHAQILAGVFEGRTTGAPLSILILNEDANSNHYDSIKDVLRPGHANFTYLEKYGLYDHRGGGRASARETAARVAAGAVAKKFLSHFNIQIAAYIKQIGSLLAQPNCEDLSQLRHMIHQSPIYCPDELVAEQMMALLNQAKEEGDSLGGIVEFIVAPVPIGLGDPVYEKIEAKLAYALMSLPATKGFEMGSGFQCVNSSGSKYNDLFDKQQDQIKTLTNNAGGTLGGISNGMPLVGRAVFKPTSSIQKVQLSLNLKGEPTPFELPKGSRHDPCVAIRAVAVVEAMVALVLADAILLNRCVKL